MDIEIKLDAVVSQLSHDLKNHFVLIRAAAGSIKRHIPPSDLIDKKLAAINQALDQAIAHLEIAYTKAVLISAASDQSDVK